MKNSHNIKLFLGIVFLALGITSCLKDDKIDNLEYGIRAKDLEINKIIEFPIISHVKSLPVLVEGVEATVEIGKVHLAAKDAAQEDIVVNLKLISDRAEVLKSVRYLLPNRYPATGKDSVPDGDILSFPNDGISIPATVTIPKGNRDAIVTAKIKTDKLKAESAFIRMDIESAQQPGYLVSGNFGQLLLNIKIKSKFEGRYEYACEALGPWPQYLKYVSQGETYLSTVSPNKVQLYAINGLFGEGDIVIYEFDDNNKIVSVEWPTWPATAPIKVLESTYDAATKTTTVKWEIAPRPGKTIIEKFKRLD